MTVTEPSAAVVVRRAHRARWHSETVTTRAAASYTPGVVPWPVPVALATTAPGIPTGPGWAYEPKSDGWRAVVDTARRRICSRTGTDLTERFLDVVSAAAGLDSVLDGELVALRGDRLAFSALASSAPSRARAGVQIYLVVFDLLAAGGQDLRKQPYQHRRDRLVELLADVAPPLQLVPMTTDPCLAHTWMDEDYAAVGIEGVVSKRLTGRYRDRRDWVKTKQKQTLDLEVVGIIGAPTDPAAVVLAHPAGRPQRLVGISNIVRSEHRRALRRQVRPTGTTRAFPGVLGGLPGQPPGSYTPIEPGVIVEVLADHSIDYGRFRHRPTILRVRNTATGA